ncbi:MAG TPA: hypothetical protein P5555_04045 [Candidatus Paceibacterota bacterium]|nr:hypothetical protein [Verrucomicrobiota bacterium]HOX01605.1 hypothetical protein [Verrucomicrobiota bacterium]HRZ44343.1 hypothetical protein [Candidatus Paceibacterota bacterium]HRZ93193.1 hypothetical protein [Candidatus Paceibacterota bacterium]
MTLSLLALLLGALIIAPALFALTRPEGFVAQARRFPRSRPWGFVLVPLATAWFLYYLSLETISDFAAFKPYMYVGFALLGALTCIYVQDFLAVRGLALVLMLLGKLMIDTALWADTAWRLVIIVWAYLIICAGMWLTVSPWRLRDLIDWATAEPARLRALMIARLGLGLFVAVLGLTAFR